MGHTVLQAPRVSVGDGTTTATPMTVGQLRTALRDVPETAWVILDSDAEGNEQKPLLEISIGDKAEVIVTDGYARVELDTGNDAVILTPFD